MKRAAHHQSKIRPENREPAYQALRDGGMSRQAASERLGLSHGMAERYEDLRRAGFQHSATTALGPMNHDAHVEAVLAAPPRDGWRGFERVAA
jgi:hypothetical protein